MSAHRGGGGEHAENSLSAYRAAAKAGLDVEADAKITADGVAVMFHDDKVGKSCNSHVGDQFRDLTADQVAQMTCNGEPVPTLAATLKVIKNHPDATLNLESKTYAGQDKASVQKWATQIVGQVVDAGLAGRTTMQAFDWDSIPAYKKVSPDIATTALTIKPTLHDVNEAVEIGASGFSYAVRYQSTWLNDYIHDHGMQAVEWTADNDDNFEAAVYSGADDVITNRPSAMAKHLTKPFSCERKWTDQLVHAAKEKISQGQQTQIQLTGSGKVPEAGKLDSVVITVHIDKPSARKSNALTVTPSGASSGYSQKISTVTDDGRSTQTLFVHPEASGSIDVKSNISGTMTVDSVGYMNLSCS